jgi:acid phosphatase family membrane protein YuiD
MVLYELITNEVLIIPLAAWAISQLLKFIVMLIKERQLDFSYLVVSGGMPSSHSAMVTALATSVAIINGFGSVTFGIATIFALIVMYDSAGVRQSVGQQAAVLNRIIRELRLHRPVAELERDLKEFMGHTSFQVIVGGLIGVLIAVIWFII